jgi:hypothetical protein
VKDADEMLTESRDGLRLMIALIINHVSAPSPFFEATPEQLAAHQRHKNYCLKLELQYKRKYHRPIKPLPLP